MLDTSLDAEIRWSNYPKLFLHMLGWVFLTGVVAMSGSVTPGIVVLLGVFGYLTLYQPKYFLLAVVIYYLLHNIFAMQSVYSGWGVWAGHGRGNLYLSTLRRIHPGAPSMHQIDKIFFGCILLRLIPPLLRDPNKFKLNRMQLLLFLFLVSILLSAIANMTFNKTVARYFYQFGMPFFLYLYGNTLKFSFKERQYFFGILMFICVEGQIFFSMANNFPDLIKGKIFYGDFAVGTFVYPLYEFSAYVISAGFFYYLYSFLIHRNIGHLIRAVIALYGILSISVVLFTIFMAGFTVASFFYVTTLGIIKVKELFLALFAMVLLSGPVYLVFAAEDSSSGTAAHMEKHMEKNSKREWWEIPKIYSFVNLYNMMDNERRWFFGAGPGNFLTRIGNGPLYFKYSSFNIYKTTQLSSSEMLENTTVGMIGDIGLHGYLFYVGMYFLIIRKALRLNKTKKRIMGESDPFCTMVIVIMLFYWIFAMVRTMYEVTSFFAMMGFMFSFGFQHVEEEIKAYLAPPAEEVEASEEPLPEPIRPTLSGVRPSV